LPSPRDIDDRPLTALAFMLSRLLVTLQFALIAALAVPWGAPDVGAWVAVLTRVPAVLPIGGGIALGLWALGANRPGNFNVRPEPRPGGHLVTTGPYRFIRHPMYLAVLLFAAGLLLGDLVPWRFAAFIALAAVLHLKAAIEERLLRGAHPGYADYARRTPRLIPFLHL
jgi:protein-S-isoprenylcysteine O-methyltransferase Ste14